MADEMRLPSYWKPLASASSRLSSFKGYLSQRDSKRAFPMRKEPQIGEIGSASKRQTWTQWAGQKIAKVAREDSASESSEKIILFPGWASRRYHHLPGGSQEGAPFDVEVFVSGYAVKHRAPGLMTRSQKTVLRLAKSFASLPKVAGPPSPEDTTLPLSKSTEALLATMELPPRPDEITDESEVRALHSSQSRYTSSVNPAASQTSLTLSPTGSFPPTFPDLPPLPATLSSSSSSGLQSELHRLHLNLESRLHPFWAAALCSRTIRISVYPYVDLKSERPSSSSSRSDASSGERAIFDVLLANRSVLTAPDGGFQLKFTIPWEQLCTHPKGVHIAFGDPMREHDFVVRAELLPTPQTVSRPQTPTSVPVYTTPSTVPTANTTEMVPLTFSPVRVISDIDDTCKLSSVASGARTVFYNVFVRDLRENVIRGMGDWYGSMWNRGVRFHYVSNGPFELLPVISEFLQLAQLPPGSIRLRSYGTRNLFNGLLSAPATRKRGGVLDVLKSFPDSRFILIGDSGEQDLELYASLAKERPTQILAVFIRDVNNYEDGGAGINDPTGISAADNGSIAQALSLSGIGVPGVRRGGLSTARHSESLPTSPTKLAPQPAFGNADSSQSFTEDYFTPKPPPSLDRDWSVPGSRSNTPPRYTSGTFSAEPSNYGPPSPSLSLSVSDTGSGRLSMSEVDKKRYALQARVWKARGEMPRGIVLRAFREPEECVEAGEILDRLGIKAGIR
ncbi:hypothetical protein EW146_g4777 [Bondarzewia mesenterica]|uniref:Phosphatidate phosphatase APP1 catalytic domain-containing protein n=1 Tax=Bondarzewia mesenterica TaxID=1095465 RepID=A0A4S4LTI2_9AGAM|nr:hypothetical protein EW146_g4777 [Bondarzewia mesenterica]